VTGIDLTESFVHVATDLTRRAGLADLVTFRQGSALSLPFPPRSFDAATMIHVGMNIEDKAALFSGVNKVLRPGGRFGIFDIMELESGALTFPVPWSSKPDTSFVAPLADYRRMLSDSGFIVEKERNRRDFAIAFFSEMREKALAAKTSGKLSPSPQQLIMGPDFQGKMKNAVSAVERGLIAPVELICRAK
jgi:ubiquinone/menaquinone biosynthesis C-methylase UbiE